MSPIYIPYRLLLARMSLSGLRSSDVAERLGISFSTMRNKIKGVAPFTLEEAIRIRQILETDERLEVLFEKTAQGERRSSRAWAGEMG